MSGGAKALRGRGIVAARKLRRSQNPDRAGWSTSRPSCRAPARSLPSLEQARAGRPLCRQRDSTAVADPVVSQRFCRCHSTARADDGTARTIRVRTSDEARRKPDRAVRFSSTHATLPAAQTPGLRVWPSPHEKQSEKSNQSVPAIGWASIGCLGRRRGLGVHVRPHQESFSKVNEGFAAFSPHLLLE